MKNTRQGVSKLSLDTSIPTAVVRLFRQLNRVHNKALKPLGLSTVQAHILSALFTEGAMTSGNLQRRLAMGSSTLTGALDRMEKSGLVSRRPIPADRRASQLVPVAWNKARRERFLTLLTDTENTCLRGLTRRERGELLRLLSKLSSTIESP